MFYSGSPQIKITGDDPHRPSAQPPDSSGKGRKRALLIIIKAPRSRPSSAAKDPKSTSSTRVAQEHHLARQGPQEHQGRPQQYCGLSDYGAGSPKGREQFLVEERLPLPLGSRPGGVPGPRLETRQPGEAALAPER